MLRNRKSGIGRGDSRTPLNNGLTPARVAATLPPFQLVARIGRERGRSFSLSPPFPPPPQALPSCAWSHNRRAFLLLPLHACHPPRGIKNDWGKRTPFPGYLERSCQKQAPVSAFSDRRGKDKSRKEEVAETVSNCLSDLSGRHSFTRWDGVSETSLSLPSTPPCVGRDGFFSPCRLFSCSGEGVLLELGAELGWSTYCTRNRVFHPSGRCSPILEQRRAAEDECSSCLSPASLIPPGFSHAIISAGTRPTILHCAALRTVRMFGVW